MKVDPKEITKVFEEQCDSCNGTGFEPKSLKLTGMKAWETPKLEFTFRKCSKGCPEVRALLGELLGDFEEVF